MNVITFLQQEDFDYIPLKLGLGIITQDEAIEMDIKNRLVPIEFTPLKYTIRLRNMDGVYTVTKGIKYEYMKLEPQIKIKLTVEYLLSMKTETIHKYEDGCLTIDKIDLDELAENCFGIKGTTFGQLKRKLLDINKSADLNSVFYIHKIDRLYKLVG